MSPLVSVIIPSFNSAHYLADAVNSAFAQTYPAVECIVVDDGSTDRTEEVLNELLARHPRLRIARKANGGPSSARNVGLRLCSGSLVAFLDADDVFLPDKIERQAAFLERHPAVGLVYSDYLLVSKELKPFAVFAAEMPRRVQPLDSFCYRNWFNPVVTLIRRSVIDAVGEFDEAIAVAEDWDYWIRCAKVTRMAYLAGPVALYRQHGDQIHRDHFRMRKSCIQVATKNFSGNRKRLRAAMAAIEFTHATYLWQQGEKMASLLTLVNCAFRDHLGLGMGGILKQIEVIGQSQLKPL